MIRAYLAPSEGRPGLAIVGLDRDNMLALQAHSPILQPSADLGIPGKWLMVAMLDSPEQADRAARAVSAIRGVPLTAIVCVGLAPGCVAQALEKSGVWLLPPRRIAPDLELRIIYAPSIDQVAAALSVPPAPEMGVDDVAHWMPELRRYVMAKREPGENGS